MPDSTIRGRRGRLPRYPKDPPTLPALPRKRPTSPEWTRPMTAAEHFAARYPGKAVEPVVTEPPGFTVTTLRACDCHIVTQYERPACLAGR